MRESYPYKRDLIEFAASFRRRRKLQRWTDPSLSKAEKMLYIGFLFIRRLIECNKVTDACARSNAVIKRATIQRTREVSAFLRDGLIDDIDNVNWTLAKVDIQQLSEKVLHTWWLLPVQERSGLDGFILTTDRLRNKELWLVPTTTIIKAFATFGRNDVRQIHARRDPHGRLTYWRAT
jgi:hypothetical protein